jgi:ribosome recycling factor
MKLDVKDYESKMKKTIAAYESELDSIRLGRANPVVLNKITVDYYGCPTQIAQMAEVKAVDARTLTITPWDSTTLRSIEKAIHESDLGINPQNDGKVIRLAFPPMTEETRKQKKKEVEAKGEEIKVAIRNIRRDANDKCKQMKKNSEMTEDEQKTSEKQVQDLTDSYIKKVDAVTAAKVKEIMEI